MKNSYDLTTGVQIQGGGWKTVCLNGCVWGVTFGSSYHRHTSGIDIVNMGQQIQSLMDAVPKLTNRIQALQETPMDNRIVKRSVESLGQRLTALALPLIPQEWLKSLDKLDMAVYGSDSGVPQDYWTLYNRFTDLITHESKPQYVNRQLEQVSKVFSL